MPTDLSALTIAATKPGRTVARGLARLGIHVVAVHEDEGDIERYIISERLAVECRNGSGFIKGIMDKTLFTSAVFLREHYRLPVLIVEGEVDYEYRMMDPRAVRGALSSMILQYELNVLSTANTDETVQLIAMMGRQEQAGIPEVSFIPKRKATSLPDMQRRVVEMLPGCGMVMARELLQHFGSVKRIANADKRAFAALKGIGAGKAQRMHDVLTAEYGAVDTERQLEEAIERDWSLLFDHEAQLLARQLFIYADNEDRHIVDMVYHDPASNELLLVELKRGMLTHAHHDQISRYLDNAEQSPLLNTYMAGGARLRGILATVEPCSYTPKRRNVAVTIIDRVRVVAVLNEMRRERLHAASQ